MKFLSLVLISLIYNIKFSVSAKEQCKQGLQFVSVMFRHGERTPEPEQMEEFRRYAEKDNKFEPPGLGQLTDEGRRTLNNLGKKLRARYVNKLYGKMQITRSDVRMKSTHYPRCLMSAQLVLNGLLKHNKDPVSYDWQKSPFFNKTLDTKQEVLYKLYYNKTCPEFKKKIKSVLAKPLNAISILYYCTRSMLQMYFRLRPKSTTPLTVWFMYELFKAQENTNVELPRWVTPSLYGSMEGCIQKFLNFAFGTEELKQMAGGGYADRLLTTLRKVADSKEKVKQKMHLFAGHDTTVAPAVAALGGPNGFLRNGEHFTVEIPTYGSAIVTELHKDSKCKPFVKFYFWNNKKTDSKSTRLRVIGCGDNGKNCYLDQYEKLLKNIRTNRTQAMLVNQCAAMTEKFGKMILAMTVK